MKKKAVIKLFTLCLCGALTVTGAVTHSHASTSENDATALPIVQTAQTQWDNVKTEIPSTKAVAFAEKDETVYILANADGSTGKIIVSDWLKNASSVASLRDLTSLSDLENVKGDESFTQNQDEITWNAQGKDIYYQGTTTKELPVCVKVTYLLDGQAIKPAELKGKSGHVTIRYTYENHQSEKVEIGGKQEEIYVPFTMLTGLLLDGDIFQNVEVTGGRLVNDGDRYVVVGLAFPGLQQNLNVDADKFDIPDSLEIEADVTNFSLGTSVTVATNELFSKLDVEKYDSLEDLQNATSKLTDAMEQLLDGSGQLSDGLKTLLEKSGDLASGVDQLATGTQDLHDGAKALDDGAAELATGAAKLNSGLDTITSNNDSLNDGARQVFETLLGTARTQLVAAGLQVPEMTIDNYGTVLDGVIASLDENAVYATALQTVTNAVNDKRDYIQEQVTAAVQTQVENGVTAAVRTQVEEKVTAAVQSQVEEKVTAAVRSQVEEKVTSAVSAEVTSKVTEAIRQNVFAQVVLAATNMDTDAYNTAVEAGMIPEENQQAILAAVDAKMASDEIGSMITAKTEEQMASDEVNALIAQNTEAQMASEDIKTVIAAKTGEQMATDEVKTIIAQNAEAQMTTDEVKAIIATNVNAKMAEDSIRQLVAQNTEAQVQKAITDNMAGDEVQGKLAAASEGAKSVINLKASLDSYNTFYHGIQSYTAGVSQAASGAGQLASGAQRLKDGSSKLYAGTEQLNTGMQTLKDSIPALIDGIQKLHDGSTELKDGLQKFDDEGIQKLVDAVDGDLEGLSERIKATANVSKHYKNYSGIEDGTNGQVKFIYRISGIE